MFFDRKKFTQDEEVSRKSGAKTLLENKLFNEAFEALIEDYTEAWKDSKALNEREGYWLAINLLGKVKQHLQIVIENGSIAEKEIERLNR
jgi:hypothetical protein